MHLSCFHYHSMTSNNSACLVEIFIISMHMFEQGKSMHMFEQGKSMHMFEQGKSMHMFEQGKSMHMFEQGKSNFLWQELNSTKDIYLSS